MTGDTASDEAKPEPRLNGTLPHTDIGPQSCEVPRVAQRRSAGSRILLEWTVALLAVGGMVAAVAAWAASGFERRAQLLEASETRSQVALLLADVWRLRGEVRGLRDQIRPGGPNLPPDPMRSLRLGLDALDSRLAAMEQAINVSPEKALALPLLRKDLEALQESHRRELILIREDLARTYGLGQWLIGVALAFGLAILGLVVKSRQHA